MKWPQHRDDATFQATAPYNFIPQAERAYLPGGEAFHAHDRLDSGRRHGWIDITITTETPFYTRAAYPPEDDPAEARGALNVSSRQESYHHGDVNVPVIPGSSIRGAVRNLVEILSASRLTRRVGPGQGSRVLDERLVHRAVADRDTPAGIRYAQRFQDVRAGWLVQGKDGRWQILPAQIVNGQSFARVPKEYIHGFNPEITPRNASPGTLRVWLTGKTLSSGALVAKQLFTQPGQGIEATLVPSGSSPKRSKYTAVFPPDMAAAPLEISEDVWRQWEADRDMKRGLPNRTVTRSNEPVFYLVDAQNKLVFFGPTLNFRLPYERWTLDFVPEAERLPTSAASQELSRLDLAEAMFGTVNDGHRTKDNAGSPVGAHRGRVLFDDVVCTTEAPFLQGAEGGRRYPSILSSPKPTSFQMYLVQPNSLGTDSKQVKKQLLGWESKTPDEGGAAKETTTLRGFKRYWHRGSPPDLDEAPPESEVSERFRAGALFRRAPTKHKDQYTRIRPVRAGAQFTGRIRFENLSPVELGALLAALELPGSCRHHLGMGKPHGMGTVQISASVHLIDAKARYLSLSDLGEIADAGELLRQAKRAFVDAMRRHHNDSVVAPKLPDSDDLYAIPRLAALKEMLEWEARPARERTQNQSLQGFKARLPLPTPFGVRGRPAPKVDADVQPPPVMQGRPAPKVDAAPRPRPVMQPPARAGGSASRSASPPSSAQPVETRSRGVIVRFSPGGIVVRLDGGMELTLRATPEVFSLEEWRSFKAENFPPNRPVLIVLSGVRVLRVHPENRR